MNDDKPKPQRRYGVGSGPDGKHLGQIRNEAKRTACIEHLREIFPPGTSLVAMSESPRANYSVVKIKPPELRFPLAGAPIPAGGISGPSLGMLFNTSTNKRAAVKTPDTVEIMFTEVVSRAAGCFLDRDHIAVGVVDEAGKPEDPIQKVARRLGENLHQDPKAITIRRVGGVGK